MARLKVPDIGADGLNGQELEDLQVAVQHLGRLLSSRKVAARVTTAAGVNVTQQGVVLLRALRRNGRQPVAALGALASMDLGAVSREVKALDDAKLVTRTTDPEDGRVTILELSPRGAEVAGAIRDVGVRHLGDALDGWSATDVRELTDLLHRFVDDLQSTPVPPSPTSEIGALTSGKRQ